MTYIYDILLNFTDDKRILEFYEWSNNDYIDHIKKIPLYRVSSKKIENIINNDIIVDNNFLESIKNKTLIYKNKNYIKYACLLSDCNKVVAVEFNDEGKSVYKSFLMLDEEEEVIDEVSDLEPYDLILKEINKNSINYFLTRQELYKQNYLKVEIDSLYKSKNFDKLNFLYEEIFDFDNLNINDRYKKFIDDITNNYNNKYNKLYNVVRLSYSKNKVKK